MRLTGRRLFLIVGSLSALVLSGAVAGGLPEALTEAPADTQDTTQRSLRWSASGAHTLELSNVIGALRVTGYDGPAVDMTATRTIRAATAAALDEARTRSRIDTTESADLVRICGNQERCGCGDRSWHDGDDWRDHSYQVTVDFDVRVPRNTTLKLCTVSGGDITVDDIAGDFEASNVNGGIQLAAMSGSGRATTVNGPVRAAFSSTPRAASSFKTANGDIEVRLPADLSADLSLKTVNGGLFTDFDVTSLPPAPLVRDQFGRLSGGRLNRFASVRAGRGGPELRFEGVNGNVRVLRAAR